MKHILLFFLSDIHLAKETQQLQYTPYQIDERKTIDCFQTNESAIEYLMYKLAKSGKTLDAVFYFSSNKTKDVLPVFLEGKLTEHTHEEWFRNQISKKFPVLPSDFFQSVDYDETKKTDESIRQVISMTDLIKKYLAKHSGERVFLHADMTGGFRHASMMMLTVMQLLRVGKAVEIGNVLYSNRQRGRIEDVTEVHRMFTLISGADEFVNFGSVTEIDNYFANMPAPSETLRNLLSAMREFSFAVKICRTNRMETIIEQLKDRIDDFGNDNHTQLREEIFRQIINIIDKEYGDLLLPKVPRIDIIRWCIHKGFLQQAMTLCTEWLPFILIKKKICYTEDKTIIKEAGEQGSKENRAWQQSFIISYNKANKYAKVNAPIQKATQPGLQKAMELYLEGRPVTDAANAFPEAQDPLKRLFSECIKYPDIFIKICPRDLSQEKLRISDFKIKAPMMEKACRILWRQEVQKNANYNNGFEQFIKGLNNNDDLIRRLHGLPAESYPLLLGVEKPPKNEKSSSKSENKEAKWQKRKFQYECMLKAGIMKTIYPNEVLTLLKGFFDIRTERNHINHANDDGLTDSALPIDEMMLTYLDQLEKY